MTLIALLELTLSPDSLAEAPAVIDQTLAATRAFPGCLGLEVLTDVDDPTHVVVFERWESAQADAAYRAWRQTPDGASDLGSVLASPPRLTRFSTPS